MYFRRLVAPVDAEIIGIQLGPAGVGSDRGPEQAGPITPHTPDETREFADTVATSPFPQAESIAMNSNWTLLFHAIRLARVSAIW